MGHGPPQIFPEGLGSQGKDTESQAWSRTQCLTRLRTPWSDLEGVWFPLPPAPGSLLGDPSLLNPRVPSRVAPQLVPKIHVPAIGRAANRPLPGASALRPQATAILKAELAEETQRRQQAEEELQKLRTMLEPGVDVMSVRSGA